MIAWYSVMSLHLFFFSSRRRHTRYIGDWRSDVCSSDLPGIGIESLGRDVGGIRRRSRRANQFRQTEVQDLHAAVARQEDVLRFQVAMDNAFGVSGAQTASNTYGVVEARALPQRSVLKAVAQRLSLQEFGDNVEPFLEQAHVIHRDDVGMIESAGGAGFLLESRAMRRIGGQGSRQELDRNLAVQARIACAIDFAHAAGADGGNDQIWAQPGSSGKGHNVLNDCIPSRNN